ncbi:hypothetical protein ACVITL_006840 [Rhizobium pisi]
MKSIASVAFGIVSSVGACVAAATAASYVVADSEPHAFNAIAALWKMLGGFPFTRRVLLLVRYRSADQVL